VDQRDALRGDLELLLQRLFGLAESEGLHVLAEVDLTWLQVRVTMLLACSEPLPIHTVADRLGISIHAAGRTIDQLVDHRIVSRHESPTDRRVKLVSLTPRGLEIIDGHAAHKRQALQLFVDRLPDDHVTRLAEAVRPILAGDYLQPGSVVPEVTHR
jgi:DNA-binding MarR family transcriptional regulator